MLEVIPVFLKCTLFFTATHTTFFLFAVVTSWNGSWNLHKCVRRGTKKQMKEKTSTSLITLLFIIILLAFFIFSFSRPIQCYCIWDAIRAACMRFKKCTIEKEFVFCFFCLFVCFLIDAHIMCDWVNSIDLVAHFSTKSKPNTHTHIEWTTAHSHAIVHFERPVSNTHTPNAQDKSLPIWHADYFIFKFIYEILMGVCHYKIATKTATRT